MTWQLLPAREHFPDFAAEWDRLNRELYKSHPLFDSRFVGPLLETLLPALPGHAWSLDLLSIDAAYAPDWSGLALPRIVENIGPHHGSVHICHPQNPSVQKLGTDWTAPAILLALFFSTSLSAAHAATLRVGPGEQLTRIADAAKLAKDGDTVEILPGEYRGDVAVWQQKSLTIRGLGQRPVLIADGKSAEGKAIWVIRNGNIRIENIEFRGARVSDRNGAGIRFERGKLTVRHCAFLDNQNGLLTAGFGDAELTIENSEFSRNGTGDGQSHNLYVGPIARLSVSGSRFHTANVGHLIKSRAKVSDIRYNLIHDGPGGEASYEINLPNGGIATLIGNIVGQSDKTQNPVVISYGEEGNTWPENRLTLVHNTLYSERLTGTWFLRAPFDKFPDPPQGAGHQQPDSRTGPFHAGRPRRIPRQPACAFLHAEQPANA